MEGQARMTLTPKQEAFAKAYVETGNASAAYRTAYGADGWTENALNVQASKMLKHPKIVLRLSELQRRAQERHDITIDTITEMLKADRELARERGQCSAAVNAAMGLAKLHGLIVDKTEHSGGMTMTHEQRLDELERKAYANDFPGSERPEHASSSRPH